MKAGFYRIYTKDRASNLDEAIELARADAVSVGFDSDSLEVNRQQTGDAGHGDFHVALLGRTKFSLEREAIRAKNKKREVES